MWAMFKRPVGVLVLLTAFAVTACNGAPDHIAFDRVVEDEIYGTLPAEKALDMGKTHYREGQFGLAEQSFRRAVEQDKSNVEAWLGLAASYDRLRRFDQANRAYGVVLKLSGRTPTVLNNLGYHYMLRGDYSRARATLAEAQRADPQNEHVRSNIDLVTSMEARGTWSVTVDR
jgi:Flp pilus assembly protein TadD